MSDPKRTETFATLLAHLNSNATLYRLREDVDGLEQRVRELVAKWNALAEVNDTKGEAAFFVAFAQRTCAGELTALLWGLKE